MILEINNQNNIVITLTLLLILTLIIILILSLIIYRFSSLNQNNRVIKDNNVVNNNFNKELAPIVNKKFTMDDIKDEEMMVAALVATIDYANETKKDVRLISIRQIG